MLDTVTSMAPNLAGSAALLYLGMSYFFNGISRPGDTSANASYQIDQLMDMVDSIAELESDWADSGSIAPSAQVVDFARTVVLGVCSKALFADIAPMPNGTIAFDWETDEGCANLEIGETSFSFYLDLEGERGFYPFSGSISSIPVWLGDFIAGNLLPGGSPVRPGISTSTATASVNREPVLAYA